MAEPFIAEIRLFGFAFAPLGWAQCNGTIVNIAQNTQLFSLIGAKFGGDGMNNFALPDLRGGKIALGAGSGPGLSPRSIGETGGAVAVLLNSQQVPTHGHTMNATNVPADVSSPTTTTALARSTGKQVYGAAKNTVPLAGGVIGPAVGGSQPHANLMPYQAVNFCIAIAGLFPPRG